MHLILSPNFRLTKHKTNIILHNSRLGGPSYVQSISATEAIVLALYDGTRNPEDVVLAMKNAQVYSEDDINNVMRITQLYQNLSVLVDIDSLNIKNKSQLQVYDPLDFAFNTEIKTYSDRLEKPISFTYLPTLSCNRLCRYCYSNAKYLKNEERIPFTRLLEIIDEAYCIGIRSINISGGEPFLRQDLTDILEYMLGLGIYPILSTKAALSEDIVQRLSRAGLEDIQVSLDSPEPETANFLTGSSSFYQDIIQTIQLLVKHGLKVNLNCVLTSYNIRQLPSLLDLATDLGVSKVTLTPYAISIGRHETQMFPSKVDIEWLDSILPHLKEEHPELINTPNTSPNESHEILKEERLPDGLTCTIGTYGFVLLPNGDVSVCERLTFVLGNLNNQSIMEVWNLSDWDKFCNPAPYLYEGTECYSCEVFEKCSMLRRRCIVNTMAVFGRYYGPNPNCPRIKNQSSVPSQCK
jgi:radical SAM protein with 4Fe4S-binding SPASM domain